MKNLFILCFLLFAASLFAQSTKIDALVLNDLKTESKVECLLLFMEQANVSGALQLQTKQEKGKFVFEKLQATSKRTQVKAITLIQDAAAPFIPFLVANAIWVRADAALLNKLAALDEVKAILPNKAIRSHFPVESTPAPVIKSNDLAEWGIRQIQADRLWDLGITGAGVTVGGQDTGYEWDNASLKSKYRGWDGSTANHNFNWHDAIHEMHPLNTDSLNPCGFNASFPCDDHVHGTHTMGTMVGYDGQNNYIGVAPGAKWVGCRNMERGWGSPASYIECFEWFLAPTNILGNSPNPDLAPHVINNSWACPSIEGCNESNFEVMRIAVHNLRMAGVVVVVSAGNDGPTCYSLNNPAAIFEESFSVAASTPTDSIAKFSSRGPVYLGGKRLMKPNVAAPGTGVRSCLPGGGFASFNGTSMAGPHVAGAVALLISADPSLAGQVDRIVEILEQTAIPINSWQACDGIAGEMIPNASAGYGRIDLWKALTIVRPDLVNNLSKEIYQIRIFPNPSNGAVLVVLPSDMDACNMQVYNPIGQLILERNMNFKRVQHIDLTELANGTYFLHFQSKENPKLHFTGKLLMRS